MSAEAFLNAIPKSGGIITTIAKRIPCSWSAARNFIDSHPNVRKAYNDECEAILDLAETKLYEAVQNGDGGLIKYILSTKGKHRGYVERQEITGEDGGPVKLKVEYGRKKAASDGD